MAKKGIVGKILFVKEKLFLRPELKKIVFSVSWLTADRILQLVVSLLVGLWVARYLGPSDFGLMNFAIAFTSLFGPFVGLGVSSILVRELINFPKKRNVLFGTTFWIQFITGTISMALMCVFILILRPLDMLSFWVVFVFSLGYVISAFDLPSFWFESKIESKTIVISRTGGLIVSNLLKIVFILLNFSLIFIVIASLFDTIVRISFIFYSYFKDKQSLFLWKFDFGLAKRLISSSWPLIFSGAMVIIYLRIDQVMLGFMMNDYEVGLYSVAVKISELFVFIPGLISVSVFPTLVRSKKISAIIYHSRLQKVFDLMTWAPFLFMVPIFFFSDFIIYVLYGSEYLSAGFTLSIIVWSALAISVKFILEKYLINENKLKTLFFISFFGAVTNIILNLILIPLYGINGAALATVISYTLPIYTSLLFFKSTRHVSFMLIKSFNIVRVFKEAKEYLFS
ncbi:putative flippase AglR [uncultured archaeon]|nr:putative flippase AglR [uncultured archaeon]